MLNRLTLKKCACFLNIAAIVISFFAIINLGFAGQDESQSQSEYINPIADVWRQVREGVRGYSSVTGQETDELIQGSGQNWRQLRNGPIATYAVWLLALTFFGIVVFFILRGQVKLSEPRTGIRIERWSLAERLLHWLTAIVFIILTVTGLSLLYGRALLIPILSKEEFAAYADIAMSLHNYLGPIFIAALVMMILLWFKDNLPSREDFQWIKDFGGMIGTKHPSAGRMNAGEKIWFWVLVTAGMAVCLTGLILDFPNFGQDRLIIQLSHLVHVVLAIVLIAGALGHIYIGTIGTEGPFEGMITGKVDSSWAKQHHDLWYEELRQDQDEDEEIPAIMSDRKSDPTF